MRTVTIVSEDVAALGWDEVDLIVRTLMAFDDFYIIDEPMVTDFESEWPSEYGRIHFMISRGRSDQSREPERTIQVRFRKSEKL